MYFFTNPVILFIDEEMETWILFTFCNLPKITQLFQNHLSDSNPYTIAAFLHCLYNSLQMTKQTLTIPLQFL